MDLPWKDAQGVSGGVVERADFWLSLLSFAADMEALDTLTVAAELLWAREKMGPKEKVRFIRWPGQGQGITPLLS